MRFRTTFGLLAAVCILGAILFIVGRKGVNLEKSLRPSERVLPIEVERVRLILIEKDALKIECVRKGDRWSLIQPLAAWADEGQMERLLSVLEALPVVDAITPEQRAERDLTLKDYGLVHPRARLAIGDGLERVELLVGEDEPLGDLLFVKRGDRDEVVVTSRDIWRVLPESVDALRDRALIHGDVSRTARVEIHRRAGGFVQLVRTPSGWTMQQPVSARADAGRVAQMLDALYALRIREFVRDAREGGAQGDESYAGANVEPYGLAPDEAVARVAIWTQGDEMGEELLLGKSPGTQPDTVYARCRGQASIYTVPTGIVEILSANIKDLRDRVLFPNKPEQVRSLSFQKGDQRFVLKRDAWQGWMVVEPVQWKADEEMAGRLVEKVTRLKAETFSDDSGDQAAMDLGLNPPLCMVQVGVDDYVPEGGAGPPMGRREDPIRSAESERPRRLLIGRPQEGQDVVVARFEGNPTWLTILSADATGLADDIADPLTYRDRTVLALRPETIRRMVLAKGGREQRVMRTEAGGWVAEGAETNDVDRQAIEDILLTASNLRALRIEHPEEGKLAAFGLDRSEAVLTFELMGEGGVRKSLILGYRSETDGLYALLQGTDLVFVLEKEQAERLTKDLVHSSPPSGTR